MRAASFLNIRDFDHIVSVRFPLSIMISIILNCGCVICNPFLRFLIIPLFYHTHKPLSTVFLYIFPQPKMRPRSLWRIFRHINSQRLRRYGVVLFWRSRPRKVIHNAIPAEQYRTDAESYTVEVIYLGGVWFNLIIPFMLCQHHFC